MVGSFHTLDCHPLLHSNGLRQILHVFPPIYIKHTTYLLRLLPNNYSNIHNFALPPIIISHCPSWILIITALIASYSSVIRATRNTSPNHYSASLQRECDTQPLAPSSLRGPSRHQSRSALLTLAGSACSLFPPSS